MVKQFYHIKGFWNVYKRTAKILENRNPDMEKEDIRLKAIMIALKKKYPYLLERSNVRYLYNIIIKYNID